MPDETTPEEGNYKQRRPVTLLATIGLIGVTGAAVGGLVYDAIVNGNAPSISQIGTLATLGVGGLLALSGTKTNGDK